MSSTLYTYKAKKKLPNLFAFNLLCSVKFLEEFQNMAIFLNCNNSNGFENLLFFSEKGESLSVSEVERCENEWIVGYVSYDYKNEIENLTSRNSDNIRFDCSHFFIPELVISFNENEYKIELFLVPTLKLNNENCYTNC